MLPKGTRIVKQNSEPGDGHSDGSTGVIVGMIETPVENLIEVTENVKEQGGNVPEGHIIMGAYFIEWDDRPGIPVGTVDYKVKQKDNGTD